jgi:hypothetical protein
MANKKARKTTTSVATTPHDKATMIINLFDGTSP